MGAPLRKVLLTWHATDAETAAVAQALGGEVEVASPAGAVGLSRYECTLASIEQSLDGADAIAGWVLPPGALERASALRLLCWLHAGIDELDQAELHRRGVSVTNVRGANAPAVAEHAVALLLALAKRVPVRHRAVREGVRMPLWEPGSEARMLSGATVSIVGLGNVGGRIAAMLSGFGMRILGVRRDPAKGGEHVDQVLPPDGLRDALAQSDFVVLAMPITSGGHASFGPGEMEAMKPGAMLVNVGRGNLVDEAALRAALDSGHVGGYGCDVWWNYTHSFPATYHFPTPSRTGLHLSDAVVASGDQANNAEGVRERDIEFGIRSLREFHRGASLTLAVDLERGY